MILSMISLLGASHLTWYKLNIDVQMTSLKLFSLDRFLFHKEYVPKNWDYFGCFTAPKFEPSELFPMDPSGTKKYTEDDDGSAGGGGSIVATAAAAQAIVAEKKPARKPDPSMRTLQKQLSFGSGAPFVGLGSLKKKQMSTGTLFL